MARWLQNDLAANTQEWIIAFWHHPPYTRGAYDSDSLWRLEQMRSNFLPILESHGVDLVLAGHSHAYERSMFINGHYGTSDTFDDVYVLDEGDGSATGDGSYNKLADSNAGTVYTVAGSSGKVSRNVTRNHPVMISKIKELGSMVIDVQGNRLDAVFLDGDSDVLDRFSIVHQSTPEPPTAAVESIGSANLDHDRIQGNRWIRFNFSPQNSGTHTISVAWSGSADIRYSVYQAISDGPDQRIDLIDNASPAQWHGELDSSKQYYLGVWSSSGSTSVTATLEAHATDPVEEPVLVTLSQGTLDSERNEGSRWVSLKFDTLSTESHTVSVAWENNAADIQFRVKDANGANLSPVIKESNPSEWSGILQGNREYSVNIWSRDGVSDYTVTIHADSSP